MDGKRYFIRAGLNAAECFKLVCEFLYHNRFTEVKTIILMHHRHNCRVGGQWCHFYERSCKEKTLLKSCLKTTRS